MGELGKNSLTAELECPWSSCSQMRQSLPPGRQALSRLSFHSNISIQERKRAFIFKPLLSRSGVSEKVTGVNLVPVPLADCQPFVSRAAASTSKLAEPWEKLCRFVCSLPERTSIPSEAPGPSMGAQLSSMPSSTCGLSLQNTSTGNGGCRKRSSQRLDQEQCPLLHFKPLFPL